MGGGQEGRQLPAEILFQSARETLVKDHPFLAFPLTRLRAAEAQGGYSGNQAKPCRVETRIEPSGIFGERRDAAAHGAPCPSPRRPSALSAEPCVFPAGTDGERFFVSPDWDPDPGAAADMLFHSLVHCLRGHPFDHRLSALACDLDAALWTARAYPERCPVRDAPLLKEARTRLRGARDAASIQSRLEEDSFLQRNREALEDLLTLDDHGLWDAARRRDALRTSAGGEGLGERWRRDARKLGGGQGQGESSAGERLNIALAQDSRQDFTQVLRRYASLRENARDDPDQFQYGWYAYGLEHYGNVPLIEPLEYREERRIDRLAIVIDTSGSCARGLTQRFLELTRDILATEGLFFRRFCLHILQCDARVQRDDRIETLADFERYIRGLTVIGGGGTDFRPAFQRVDALVASGELRGLKGMLYFSDGRGIFPSAPPKYDVTFVFLKYRYDAIDVPAWVRRLILDAPKPRGGEYMEY